MSSRITAIAETKVSSGITPNATPPPSEIEAVPMPPSRSRRLSAENASSSPFWMMIDRPNVTSSGGSISRPERAVEQHMLQRKADAEHHRHCEQDRDERIEPSAVAEREDGEGREHDQVAMREIDQPHDAEDQRQAGREQRIEPAEQDALDDGVEPIGHAQ